MNLIAITSLALICSMSLSSLALVKVLDPLRVQKDVPAWDQSFGQTLRQMKSENAYPKEGYTECREVSEIDSAYLCLSDDIREMNTALGRASFYIEGLGDSGAKGKVIKQDDTVHLRYKDMVGGHDLRGADLLRFHDAVLKECEISNKDPNTCFNSVESSLFDNFILPAASKNPNFVVITFAHVSTMSWQDVVSHEIMHAQYFNQPSYRKIVDQFWETSVSEQEKQSIRGTLAQSYDANDELLMKNEFQAYTLMTGYESSMLGGWGEHFRTRLMKAMSDAGVSPIQID